MTREEFNNMSKEEQHLYLEKEREAKESKMKELSENTYADIMTDVESLTDFLSVQGRFNRLSVDNAILLYAQKPDATVIKTNDEWSKNRVGIIKGEKGILLRKREYTGTYMKGEEVKQGIDFKPYSVFDVSQTNCTPEKHKAADIGTLCDKFNSYTRYDLTAEYDEKGENLVANILKDVVSNNKDKAPIASACATASICSKMGIEPPAFIKQAISSQLPQYTDKSVKDFKDQVLKPSRVIANQMIQDFVFGKNSKDIEVDNSLPIEILDEDDEPSTNSKTKDNQTR